MANLGTLSLDFLVNLQNSMQQVGQLENRIAELERAARDSRRAVDDLGNSRIGNIASSFDAASDSIGRLRNGLQGVLTGQGGMGDLVGAFQAVPPQALLAVGSIVAVSAAVVGMGIAIKESLSHVQSVGDELDKTSQKVGVSVEELQKLRYAAEMSGASADSLQDAFKEINMAMAEGDENDKIKKLQMMGIAYRDASGNVKSADQILVESADTFAALPNDTARAALAMQLFGEQGKELVPFLKNGTQGLKDLGIEAVKSGSVLSDDAAKGAAEYTDSLTRLNKQFEGIKTSIGTAFMPAANLVVKVMTEIMKAFKGAFGPADNMQDIILKMARGALRLLIDGLEKSVKYINNVGRAMQVLAPFIASQATQIIFLKDGFLLLMNALEAFQDIIRLNVLKVVEGLTVAIGGLLRVMGGAAEFAGFEGAASALNGAADAADKAKIAIQEMSLTTVSSLRENIGDIDRNVRGLTGVVDNYNSSLRQTQGLADAMTGFGAGIDFEGLRGAVDMDPFAKALDENTKAQELNAEQTKKLLEKEGKDKDKKAKAEKKERQLPQTRFEALFGLKPDRELLKFDADYKSLVEKSVKEKEELLKKVEGEAKNYKKNADERAKLQKELTEIEKRQNYNAKYRENLQQERVRQESVQAEREALYNKNMEAIHKNDIENQNKLREMNETFLKRRESVYKTIEAAGENIPGLGGKILVQVAKVIFDTGNVARDKLTDIGVMPEGMEPKQKKAIKAQIEADKKSKIEEAKVLQRNEDMLQANIETNGQIRAKEAELEKQDLEDIANRKQKIGQIDVNNNKTLASSVSLVGQLVENARLTAEATTDILTYENLSKLTLQDTLKILQNQHSLIRQQDEGKQLLLERDNADRQLMIDIRDLQIQKLSGIRYEIELQKIMNDYAQKHFDINERIKEIQQEATQASIERANSLIEQAKAMAQSISYGTQELAILNEKDALQKIDMQYALDKQKILAEDLTSLEREIELTKLQQEYDKNILDLAKQRTEEEKKITEERRKQYEDVGAGFGDVGGLLGQLGGGLLEKLGFSKETSRIINEIGDGLGGIGQGIVGVGRIAAGDILGGTISLLSGIATTVESVFDIFNGDELSEEEKRRQREEYQVLEVDRETLREQAREFAQAFVDEQEKRMSRPVQISIDARGALVGEENEVARQLGNLLESEIGRRVGNISRSF